MLNFKTALKNRIFPHLLNFIPTYRIEHLQNETGICTLLCHQYVNYFICTIASLYYNLGQILPVYIIDDGSLTEIDKKKLSKHLPVVIESESDSKMRKFLGKYPFFRKYRFDEKNFSYRKQFDCYFLNPFKKFVYIDSDILFFDKPQLIEDFIKSKKKHFYYISRSPNIYERFPILLSECQVAMREMLFLYFKQKKMPLFNAGLLCVSDKKVINIQMLEIVSKLLYEIHYIHESQVEEMMLSLSLDRKIVKNLPFNDYLLASYYEEYDTFNLSKAVAVHYSSDKGLKQQFVLDAVSLLLKTHFFKK